MRSRISLPWFSAAAAPAALPLPAAAPLMAELSCLCSTSLPSACFSFLDLPEKAPEIAPKRFRLSCVISQPFEKYMGRVQWRHTPALALALALCSFSSRAYWGCCLEETCWLCAGFWATSEDVIASAGRDDMFRER